MANVFQNFDLTNGFNILRIMCGAFLLPHMCAKASNPPFTYKIYRDFRLYPPEAWVFSAIGIEVVVSIGLIFGIYTRFSAALGCAFLLAAAAAVWRYSGGKWLWNIGGYEYCVFWALCCLAVALHG